MAGLHLTVMRKTFPPNEHGLDIAASIHLNWPKAINGAEGLTVSYGLFT